MEVTPAGKTTSEIAVKANEPDAISVTPAGSIAVPSTASCPATLTVVSDKLYQKVFVAIEVILELSVTR